MAEEISKRTAQQIVDTVKDVCGQDINFINKNGIIIASTDTGRIGMFHGVGRQVILRGVTMEVDRDMEEARKGVNFPVFHNGKAIAAIGISGEPAEVRKYAYLTQRISALLLKERDISRKEKNQKDRLNYYLRMLILGEGMDTDSLKEFMDEYRLNANMRFQTLLIEISSGKKPDNLMELENSIWQTFESSGSKLYTFNYPNEYIGLLNKRNCKEAIPLFENLAAKYGDFLKIGLGDRQSLFDQKLSYHAAKLAIKSLGNCAGLGMYDRLDIELLFGSVPEEARISYIEKTMKELEEEDKELLKIYFEEDRSLAAASMKLNLHKNTLQYRLNRIHRRCGYDPRVFRDAVVLYSALMLQK